MALMQTFKDDFDFGGRDSGKWDDPGDNHIVIGTALNLQLNSNTSSAYYTLSSTGTYDLTGSYAFTQLVDAGNQSLASWEVYPVHLANGANAVAFMVTGGRIYARKKIDGSFTTVGSDIAYVAATHKWFRIREASGTTFWDFATDPAGSWTNVASVANPITITALHGEVIVGTWDTEATTTTAIVDNFNVLPGELQLSAWGYTWNKRTHAGDPSNNQTWSTANVTGPDSNGYVTVSLTNAAGNAPIGCEIFSAQRGFGYGTYTCVVGTRMDNMHAAIGFGGMFTFDFTDPPAWREIDVNETRPYSGQATKRLLRNHVWDNNGEREFITDDMPYPSTTVQTHRMIWSADKIIFEAFHGSGDSKSLYSQVIHSTNIPTPDLERVHFNIFVDTSVAGYANATPIDVVIRDFSFTTLTQYTQKVSLPSAEHDWFATRSGAPVNASTDTHKRAYFVSKGIAGSVSGRTKPLNQMENEWLDTLTGVTSKRYADKWLQAVAGAGKTPTQRLSENQMIFYTQVTTSP